MIKPKSKKNIIIDKIRSAALIGRGGAAYPVVEKWLAVKEALKKAPHAYIVANGAEGEPGVKKDGYILKNYSEELLEGLFLAYKYLSPGSVERVFLYVNEEYFKLYAKKFLRLLNDRRYQELSKKFDFFVKPRDLTYISGEETTILNLIEGRRVEPRLRPPYPTQHGLFGYPTLINNIETLYNVALVARHDYHGLRFYTVLGHVKRPGVYALADNLTVEDVLKMTNNYPDQPFFTVVGGGASGEVLRCDQLTALVGGAASIMVYDEKLTNKKKLFKHWISFYVNQSCGQCSVCREGSYRLSELIDKKTFNEETVREILDVLADSSFCALGASLPVIAQSYLDNIGIK